MTTVGEATLLYVDIFESGTGYPGKRGYEYIVSRFMITFDDEPAQTNGIKRLTGQLDFFGFDPDEEAIEFGELEDSDISGFKKASRELNYFGINYEYYMNHSQIQNVWVGDILYLELEYAFLVPAGYDGIVVYISNAVNWSETRYRTLSDNFDNETLFFRLRAQTN